MAKLTFHILTLFPEAVTPYLGSSMLWKAQRDKKIAVAVINPRDYTTSSKRKLDAGKRRKVDDRPYGGGPGMVMMAEPILRAIVKLEVQSAKQKRKTKIIITSPRGKLFDNPLAAKWAKQYENIVIIAGHYEGIDARVKKILKAEEISVGPYTLTGGELPALVMIDAVTRRIPGVLGHEQSLEESRVASGEVYTRPEVLEWPADTGKSKTKKKYRVPAILRSGDHKKIEAWRQGR